MPYFKLSYTNPATGKDEVKVVEFFDSCGTSAGEWAKTHACYLADGGWWNSTELFEKASNYDNDTVRACISDLLKRIDDISGPGMHWYGQTPDWYVAAAMISCDIPDPEGTVAALYKSPKL